MANNLKGSTLTLLKDGDIRAALSRLLLDAAVAIAPANTSGDLDYEKLAPSWSVGWLKRELSEGRITQAEYDERLPNQQALQDRTLSNLRRAHTGQFTYADSLWLDVLSKMLKKSKGAIVSTAYITYLRRNRSEHLKQLRAIQASYGFETLEETFLAIHEDRIDC